MLHSRSSEERFPLLMMILEGQKSGKKKDIYFDKGKYQDIGMGASTVITQWPRHLTTCWLISMILGVLLLLFIIMISTFTLHPGISILILRCRNSHYYSSGFNSSTNTTIHLVHGPHPWSQNQLVGLEHIAHNYPQSHIVLTVIRKEDEEVSTTIKYKSCSTPTATVKINKSKLPHYKTNNLPWKKYILKDMHVKDLLKMLLNKKFFDDSLINKHQNTTTQKPKTFEDLIKSYPNIQIMTTTYENVFKRTPLYITWHKLNEEMRLFSMRVLQMWNFAGITFDLSDSKSTGKIKDVITVGLATYKNMTKDVATTDEEGLHMETKTVCHAFFGEMLVKLRQVTNETMPSDVIRDVLKKFCVGGAVNTNYCRNLVS